MQEKDEVSGLEQLIVPYLLSLSPQTRPLVPLAGQLQAQQVRAAQQKASAQALAQGMQEIQGFMDKGDFAAAQQAYSGLLQRVRPEYAGLATNVQKQIMERQQASGERADMTGILEAFQGGNQQLAIERLGQAQYLAPERRTAILNAMKLNPQVHGTSLTFANPLLGTVTPNQEIPGARESITGLKQAENDITVGGQLKVQAQGHRNELAQIGAREASQKRVFMYSQLQEMPTEEIKLAARSSGLPVKPVGEYTPEEASQISFADTLRKTMVAKSGRAVTPPPVEAVRSLNARVTIMQAANNVRDIVTRRPELVGPVSGKWTSIEEALTGMKNDPDASRLITALRFIRDPDLRANAGLAQTGSEAERATGFFSARQPTAEQNPNVLLNRLEALTKDAMGAIDLDLTVYGGTSLGEARELIQQRINSPLLSGGSPQRRTMTLEDVEKALGK